MGMVIKAGNQAFDFPLGNGILYSPAGISAPSSSTDTFLAQYFHQTPSAAGYNRALHDVSINHVSANEYWLINRGATSSSNVKVTLGYNAASGGVTDMSALTVAHWYNNGSSTAWHDEGNGGTTGNNAAGTVQSLNAVTSFSPFTLASTTAANPLPLQLLDFDARKWDKQALLTWHTAHETGISRYEIERSGDAILFSAIGAVDAINTATEKAYQLHDPTPLSGANYYRLAIIGTDGSRSRSAVRSVQFEKDRAGITLYPNPASNILFVNGIRVWSGAIISVRNLSGQLLYNGVLAGEEQIGISVASWPAGVYSLEVTNGINTVRETFVRR
jgi:hypothetical protein